MHRLGADYSAFASLATRVNQPSNHRHTTEEEEERNEDEEEEWEDKEGDTSWMEDYGAGSGWNDNDLLAVWWLEFYQGQATEHNLQLWGGTGVDVVLNKFTPQEIIHTNFRSVQQWLFPLPPNAESEEGREAEEGKEKMWPVLNEDLISTAILDEEVQQNISKVFQHVLGMLGMEYYTLIDQRDEEEKEQSKRRLFRKLGLQQQSGESTGPQDDKNEATEEEGNRSAGGAEAKADVKAEVEVEVAHTTSTSGTEISRQLLTELLALEKRELTVHANVVRVKDLALLKFVYYNSEGGCGRLVDRMVNSMSWLKRQAEADALNRCRERLSQLGVINLNINRNINRNVNRAQEGTGDDDNLIDNSDVNFDAVD